MNDGRPIQAGPVSRILYVLFHVRHIGILLILPIFVIAFLLSFFLGPDWAGLVVAIPFCAYAYGVWAYLLYRLLYQYHFSPPRSPILPLVDFFLLYAITILHNAAIYASIALIDKDAFIGIRADIISRGQVLYFSFFLATETLSALGTGSIFANPFVWQSTGFVAVWLESVQALLMFTFVGWGLTRQVSRHAKNMRNRMQLEKASQW